MSNLQVVTTGSILLSIAPEVRHMILKHLFEITKPESSQKPNRYFGCSLLGFSIPNILLANKQLSAEGTAVFWSMQELNLHGGQMSAAMTE